MKVEKKAKGKGKSKGKAILGIAIVAIMVASVMAAMIGSTGAYSNGGAYNIIEKAGIQAVLIGQDLDFSEDWTEIVTVSRVIYGVEEWSITADAQNHLHVSENETQWTNPGAFYVNYNTSDGTREAWLAIGTPDMPLALKVGITEVSSIAVDTNLKIDTGGMNLFPEDRVDLKIIDPDGNQIKYDAINDQQFTNISVAELKQWYGGSPGELVTKGWTIGDYTFQIKTKSAYACGLDATSAVKDLEIRTGEIAIDADTTSTVELELVTLTVTGVAGDEIKVDGDSANVVFKAGIMDTPVDATNQFDDTIDADGIRTYAVEFNDTETYTITVTVTGPAGNPRIGDYDTVDITVSEKRVEFDMPASVTIGDRITIKGTANTGTYVSVYIDDVLYRQLQDLVLEDGEFRKEVTTTDVGMSIPGSVRLKAWIDCECKVPAGNASTTDEPTRPADGETAILVTTPELTVELSPTVVAIEDDFTVEGTAPGSRQVTILCVAPEGGGGTSLLDKGVTGVALRKASVSLTDHTFTKQMTVQEDATLGYYDIYVLSSGMDEEWDMTGESDLEDALWVRYGIPSLTSGIIHTKSQEELYNILDDMVHCAGSDDLMWMGKLKVEAAYVKLNPITDVAVGEPLVVTGTSNREEGYAIVVTCKGPVELPPTVVKLENGTFNVTFDTTGATVGTYTVKADDGDGHTDTATVEILPAIFDTGIGTYPSIFGTHNGTITPYQDINVSKVYTYPCPGTGGHTEYVKIWNNSNWNVTANWDGYTGDWHNISFNESFTLEAGNEYNYTIRTGSYPQIIHEPSKGVIGGVINCTEFTDANGRRYNNWIPAIRLHE